MKAQLAPITSPIRPNTIAPNGRTANVHRRTPRRRTAVGLVASPGGKKIGARNGVKDGVQVEVVPLDDRADGRRTDDERQALDVEDIMVLGGGDRPPPRMRCSWSPPVTFLATRRDGSRRAMATWSMPPFPPMGGRCRRQPPQAAGADGAAEPIRWRRAAEVRPCYSR
jgi:hypothetical protein